MLDDFVTNGSQGAFRQLVDRHLPVVYSVARRIVRDPHLAEEVAQNVFTTFAQKAPSIKPPQVVGGWLYNTARHLALHTVRTEQRRREREQTAFTLQALELAADDPGLAEHLEPALAELDAEDREALVLRYLGNRGLREVGAELGVSEEAARKRVHRALERLRLVLVNCDIPVSSVVLATALSSSVLDVPAGLAALISKTALAPVTGLTLTQTTLLTMKSLNTKTVVLTIATALLILGAGTYCALQWKARSVPAPATNGLPLRFANDAFASAMDPRFETGVDREIRRIAASAPAGHMKCLVAPTASGSADYLKSINAGGAGLETTRRTRYEVSMNSPLLGKRIRMSGWVKTSDVRNWAGGSLLIRNAEGHIFAVDDMTDRPIQGTTDWRQIQIVTDVPLEPCVINFGVSLYGTGEVWTDDFQIDLTASDAPITDDRIWHVWSPNPNDYAVTQNSPELHDGHPTLLIAYTPTGRAPSGSWMWWGQDIRDPEPYRGHTLRMTVWMKTEQVSGRIHPNLRPKGANFQLLAKDSLVNDRSITGTRDWQEYTLTCLVPETTQCLDTGVAFSGSGKLWIDMASLKYEVE